MDINLVKYKRIVRKINSLESTYAKLADKDFRAQTDLLRLRLKSGEKLNAILPMAYALVRQAAQRTVGLRAFDVQLLGAVAAHDLKIVEMKAGEGKTLTILFVAYLNALEGRGVHVVTANDYLAQRDGQWSKKVFDLLGLAVNYITSHTEDFDRQVAYAADITYITNNEVCFDYLKDNLLYDPRHQRQRGLAFAIVDEADSVLIDEAQTPLVISDNQEPVEKDRENFQKLNQVVKQLQKQTDFVVDHQTHTVTLTSDGIAKLEKMVNVENLYAENQEDYLYYIERLLKAHFIFEKDKDYIVEEGKIVIVDEFTGRLMQNHRYYQGIHQAIEAKEGVPVNSETETLASITFQNFFKKYSKMAGFTGTALSSAKEFRLIYGKEVVVIPTNKPIVRDDQRDRFFLTWADKINYLSWSLQEYYYKRRAILIGTRSVAKSQQVQESLIAENIPSNVLNAKHTAREAEVIAQAGRAETVTVATNMAGRGTDIQLDEYVYSQGGLIVIGTERHNSLRIDDQLIGRAGRQGDPGQSLFLISADDELIKTHFKEQYEKEFPQRQNMEHGVESVKLQNLLKKAQKRMEGLFLDQRILAFEFDKVLDTQRDSFYRQRWRVLKDDNLKAETLTLIKHEIYKLLLQKQTQRSKTISPNELAQAAQEIYGWVDNAWLKFYFKRDQAYPFAKALETLFQSVSKYYDDFEKYISSAQMREMEKVTTLKILDLLWIQHLKRADALQDAAMISSISRADFFQQYEIRMGRLYQELLFSVPPAVCKTLFRTMNHFWQK